MSIGVEKKNTILACGVYSIKSLSQKLAKRMLNKCWVHIAKYLDQSLKYGPNEMRSARKTKVQVSYVWNEQLLTRALLHSHVRIVREFRNVVGKFSEKLEKSMKYVLNIDNSYENLMKNLKQKASQDFRRIVGKFPANCHDFI